MKSTVMKAAGWIVRGLFLTVLLCMTVQSIVDVFQPEPTFRRSPTLNLASDTPADLP